LSQVTVALGYTINIGNFENIKVDFGVTDEVQPTETQQEAIDRVYELVQENLFAKVDEVKTDLDKRGK